MDKIRNRPFNKILIGEYILSKKYLISGKCNQEQQADFSENDAYFTA
jgi:hypothetical protein